MTETTAPQSRAAAPAGKNAFLFVIVTVMLDMMGFGLIVPVLPSLLTEITQRPVEEIVVLGGALTATYALMNFLAGPTLGALSDRYGRRPVLLASVGTLAVDFLIMGLADTLVVLFIGRILAGIAGATFSTANAYIADVTEPSQRARAYGMVGAAFGVGFILGPAFGGLLAEINNRAPFFAAAALAACNFVYGVFVLPESLPKSRRRVFEPVRANPFGAFKHFSKLPKVKFFLAAMGLYALAHSVYPATWSYHGAVRYEWGEAMIGLSLACVGLGSIVVQAGLIGPILKRIGPANAAQAAFIVNIVAMAGYAFAFAPWMAFAIIPVSAFGSLVGPSLNSIMSNLTPPDSQGELQGAVASLNALSMVMAPLILSSTLEFYVSDAAPVPFAGAAFLLAAGLVAVAMAPLLTGLRLNRADIAQIGAS
ncbi:MAG: TCR/Tet family MFS transporter [Pseudomonadota bacterium]